MCSVFFHSGTRAPYIQTESMHEEAKRGHSGEKVCYNTRNPLQARTPLFPLVKAPGNISKQHLILQHGFFRGIEERSQCPNKERGQMEKSKTKKKVFFLFVFFPCWLLLLRFVSLYSLCPQKNAGLTQNYIKA